MRASGDETARLVAEDADPVHFADDVREPLAAFRGRRWPVCTGH